MSEDFKAQVESRLDDLFREEEQTMEPIDDLVGLGDHPLKTLKAMLLSVEWEINDRSMEALISELKSVEAFYQKDKIILTFLRLLRPIARYIKVRKGSSHPKAAGLLSSVYNGLERVALSKEMTRKEKEKILIEEVEKYKKLKEEVIQQREEKDEKTEEVRERAGAPRDDGGAPAAQEPVPHGEKMPSPDLFAAAMEEIKALIREEFRVLRAEVRLWRDSA